MRYYVRRVNLWSAGRQGCLLGWLVALPPSLLSAWLVVWVAQGVHQSLAQIKPVTASLFGQELLRLDFLQLLQLQALAQAAATLAQDPLLTFVSITVLLMLIGGLLWMLVVLFVSLAYNLVAGIGLGLTLELDPANQLKAGG